LCVLVAQCRASEIARYFPTTFNRFFEPFLGSGAMMATVAPNSGIGTDVFEPLIDIWNQLSQNPGVLVDRYRQRRKLVTSLGKEKAYERIRQSFNDSANGADLLFLSRACYGGIVRFRQSDGNPKGRAKVNRVCEFARNRVVFFVLRRCGVGRLWLWLPLRPTNVRYFVVL